MNYPVNGKIFKQGITLIFDSFAHTDQKDITAVRDPKRGDMYYSGSHELEDTPVDGKNQPKLLVHHKNEIPLFLGPNKRHLIVDATVDGNNNEKYFAGEVQIPLKVGKLKKKI